MYNDDITNLEQITIAGVTRYGNEVTWTCEVYSRHARGISLYRNKKVYLLSSGKVTSWYGRRMVTVLTDAEVIS